MKKCNSFGRILPETEFYKSKNRKDGYQCYCKSCMKQKIEESKAQKNINQPDDVKYTSLVKKCKKCGNILPISQFYKDKTSKDGYHWCCIECYKDYRKNGSQDEVLKQNDLLKSFSSRILLDELRARGYQGELQLIQKFTL